MNVNAKSNDGWDALQTICLRHGGNRLLVIVELLIEQGIDVNNSSTGWNALFALSSNIHGITKEVRLFKIVQALVNAGLNVNTVAKNGQNILVPLTETSFRHPDFTMTVRFLIEKGLDVKVKNTKGESMGSIAVGFLKRKKFDDTSNIIKLLLSQ